MNIEVKDVVMRVTTHHLLLYPIPLRGGIAIAMRATGLPHYGHEPRRRKEQYGQGGSALIIHLCGCFRAGPTGGRKNL